jgi:branched-chain amino acid transport system permease protein
MNDSAASKFNLKSLVLPAIALVVLILLCVIPTFKSVYITVLFITIMSYVILTVAWALFSGPTGYISLAPAAFFGIGMYTAAVLGKELPFYLVIVLAALICFVFASMVGSITLRLRGIYFTIFTFGLVFLIQQVLTWWEIKFTHTRGRFVVVVDNNVIYYYMLAILVLLVLLAFFIARSKWGRALRSIGQNEEASAHSGVNTTLLKIITFGLSALFMGAAGSVLATRLTYIDPGSAFYINYSFFPVMMAIFGGMTNVYGQMAGAVVFAYLEEQLTTKFPYFYMLIFGVIMVVVITFLPDGLLGLVKRWRKRGVVKANANT